MAPGPGFLHLVSSHQSLELDITVPSLKMRKQGGPGEFTALDSQTYGVVEMGGGTQAWGQTQPKEAQVSPPHSVIHLTPTLPEGTAVWP